MSPFLLLGIAFVLLIIFYFLFRRKPEPEAAPRDENNDEEAVYVFDPATDGLGRMVSRKVTIQAPAQMLEGAKRKLVAEANPLPSLPDLQAPEGKGIEKLLVLVIDDHIRRDDTKDEIYDFVSPLIYTIEYTAEDAAATSTNADGTPQLSIVTGWSDSGTWKFQRLDTTVTSNAQTGGGTLSAQVSNLHPADPKWIGVP